jgi:hypothetical protein
MPKSIALRPIIQAAHRRAAVLEKLRVAELEMAAAADRAIADLEASDKDEVGALLAALLALHYALESKHRLDEAVQTVLNFEEQQELPVAAVAASSPSRKRAAIAE